jgi:hypothetical protein
MCSYIVNEKWHSDRLVSTHGESERIVGLAAKLISAQIREMSVDTEMYPTKQDMASNDMKCIPPLL